MPPLKPYTSGLPYSYAAGVFPSVALMRAAPQRARRLLISERAEGEGVRELRELCRTFSVREETADKALVRISGKQNCFAAVVFEKWQAELNAEKPHVVLYHPRDEGNIGTILRSLLGFGIHDIAVIRPAADVFEPRVIRASMGAIFSQNIFICDSFEAYRSEFSGHALYLFMLSGDEAPENVRGENAGPYSLVFGNESEGLPGDFARFGRAVRIPHSDAIDSLNLAVAVSIGAYIFTRDRKGECYGESAIIG